MQAAPGRIFERKLTLRTREKFAKRLRRCRRQAGYVRARAFAQALGIEENRYTRYERAEAEPNLELIRKICLVLRVSPAILFDIEYVKTDGGLRPLLVEARNKIDRCLDAIGGAGMD